jgi:hypothetical protein
VVSELARGCFRHESENCHLLSSEFGGSIHGSVCSRRIKASANDCTRAMTMVPVDGATRARTGELASIRAWLRATTYGYGDVFEFVSTPMPGEYVECDGAECLSFVRNTHPRCDALRRTDVDEYLVGLLPS